MLDLIVPLIYHLNLILAVSKNSNGKLKQRLEFNMLCWLIPKFAKIGKLFLFRCLLILIQCDMHGIFLKVMTRGLNHMANCYLVPNIRGVGYLCKTNIPSNTAFRGFGVPQVRQKLSSVPF